MRQESVTIDIATRVVGREEDIYIVMPGSGFDLYRDFIDKSAIFLEFPDIRLDFRRKEPSTETLRVSVVRSMEIQAWHAGGRQQSEPSRLQEDYEAASYGRRVGRYVGAIQRLYYYLKPGTIVAVPGQGVFSDVWIGEIVGTPTTVSGVKGYPNETFPARAVRWIGKRSKASFPEAVRDRLGTPNPIMVLDRSLREHILKAAYDQYALNGLFTTRLQTAKADFSSLDDYNIQTFVNLVSGAVAAYEVGDATAGSIGLTEALAYLKNNRQLIPELQSNINSPGFLRFTNEQITPIVVGVILALATTVGVSASTPVNIINSAAPEGDTCAVVVQEHVMGAMKLMKFTDLNSACIQIKDAKEETGLSTSIRVVPKVELP